MSNHQPQENPNLPNPLEEVIALALYFAFGFGIGAGIGFVAYKVFNCPKDSIWVGGALIGLVYLSMLGLFLSNKRGDEV